ncbi:capsid portal protein [Common bottlenose dolphin gammaherpesvirus 1 strain Sarasota]|uniref:Capsid portal protein n=1 Tax=Common bottlenose dolphin gammaherpesvirus 1 strain Sarasota TaxID=2022783 RepID=A0A1Z1NEH3_9GAMA|nr:capsid portal protein [Common bottlenose dolphin gammaherpesvirus 1 strain Sarasota]ARW78105.1 capsid portal protein [Common bottlenose dolphin gammaherpesvirus 1 strain Sarasota]
MFKTNASPTASIPVHPTTTSTGLFEILQGKYAYGKGQTLYSSLKNPGVFSRQLLIHLYKTALANCTYDNVVADWSKYETAIRGRWAAEYRENPAFKTSTFRSWAGTMRMAIEQILLHNIHQILHSRLSLSYERYVDWVVATGLVPVVRRRPNKRLIDSIRNRITYSCTPAETRGCRTVAGVVEALRRELDEIIEALTSIYIPCYSEVAIHFDCTTGEYGGVYLQQPIKVEVICPPIIVGNAVTFDSPVQRLYHNIMMCHRTAEHAKLCQLLNTGPVKAVVGSAGGNLYKDILSHLEQSAQKKDPKREMLQLLLKLAENRTVSGVTDVVEDFIADVSNNIIDKNKLFGVAGETTTQGLKKQVSNTVFKCLTNQINEQFETISGMERERELFVKKINLMEAQLSQCQNKDKGARVRLDVLTDDTLDALSNIRTTGLNLASSTIAKGETVLNSFLTQYVPPFRDMAKDLTQLWESELFHTYRLTPVVDNQGQRLYVKYTQDTIAILMGPFIYLIAGLYQMELITDTYSALSLLEIVEYLHRGSRLAIYISDIGSKYCPLPPTESSEPSNIPGDWTAWASGTGHELPERVGV